jgi:hypothetical protein
VNEFPRESRLKLFSYAVAALSKRFSTDPFANLERKAGLGRLGRGAGWQRVGA